ncbi:hypothetical protein CLOP_g14929 [Closterium sp. NIES-67]|nr:hypothetical protein CLOP_g14929 [Closterium sp. NIES-67]
MPFPCTTALQPGSGFNLHCVLALAPATLASFSRLTHLSLPLPGAIPPPILRLPRLASLSFALCLEDPSALPAFQRQMDSPALFRHLSSLSSLTLLARRSSSSLPTCPPSDISADLFHGVQPTLCSLTLLLHEANP